MCSDSTYVSRDLTGNSLLEKHCIRLLRFFKIFGMIFDCVCVCFVSTKFLRFAFLV